MYPLDIVVNICGKYSQLSARDEQVSSLTVALERAQDQVQLLQSSLDHATSSSHLRPGSVLSRLVLSLALSANLLNNV